MPNFCGGAAYYDGHKVNALISNVAVPTANGCLDSFGLSRYTRPDDDNNNILIVGDFVAHATVVGRVYYVGCGGRNGSLGNLMARGTEVWLLGGLGDLRLLVTTDVHWCAVVVSVYYVGYGLEIARGYWERVLGCKFDLMPDTLMPCVDTKVTSIGAGLLATFFDTAADD